MSAAVIPLLAAAVVVYALYKKVNVYDAFVNGAKESLPLIARILPYMAAMLIVIELLNTGGMMDMITNLLSGPLSRLGLPAELLPMALLRPFSGSAAMAFVSDIFDKNGVDSVLGMAASTMMGSSETIFYTLALYFGCVGIQKTRFTLPVALIASLVSVIASIWICNLMFG
ncbi:spore maturation protein [Eubacteriales bacterium OttesenSCG-928-K08]|nr:spore maturation protein [Eubacteriales bacterium OttesenSCG-928-K08]